MLRCSGCSGHHSNHFLVVAVMRSVGKLRPKKKNKKKSSNFSCFPFYANVFQPFQVNFQVNFQTVFSSQAYTGGGKTNNFIYLFGS